MTKTECRQGVVTVAALSMLVGLFVAGCDPDLRVRPTETKALTKDERMAWWREARFGLFVHWGVYAVPAGTYKGERVPHIGEWIMHHGRIPVTEYEKFAADFDPVAFRADDWVRLAKDAGMKYIVITSKHHDGFCLWDSKVTDYDGRTVVVPTHPHFPGLARNYAKAEAFCLERGLQSEATAGNAKLRLISAAPFYEAAQKALAKDPLFFIDREHYVSRGAGQADAIPD